MDPSRFDRFIRTIAAGAETRRAAVRLMAGSALAVAIAGADPIGSAARKGKKKRKKKPKPPQICIADWETCDLDGAKACCSGEGQCCLPYDNYGVEGGDPYCSDASGHCCTADQGGGSCDEGDQCCPLRPRYLGVNDYCESAEGECCDDAVGGSCGPGLECCVDPEASPQYTCCPKLEQRTTQRVARAPRNFRRRRGAHRR